MGWLENLVINTYNRRRARRDAHAGGRAAPTPQNPEDGDTLVIGSVIPSQRGAFPQADGSVVATLPLAARRRHLYAIGATGCGKTSFLLRLIDDDLAQGRSLVIVDLRGDLVDRVMLRVAARYPQGELGRRVLLIDLRQNEWVVGFNPLVGAGDAVQRAYHTLEVLQRNAESWGVQLDETLRNCLLALAQSGGTLLDVDRLLSDPGYRAEVLSHVQDPFVLAFFERFEALGADKQLTWRLPVINKITAFLAVPQVRRMLAEAQPGWSLSEVLDTAPGSIVLVALGVHRLGSAASLMGGLFVSALENAIMARADKPESARIPVHFYLDEFENLVSDRFEAFLAEGRRFGLGLTLSHQNLAQMPDGLRQMILANANTQLYFQVGAQDAAVLASEVVPLPGSKKEELRRALTMQPVGEAFFLRRGQSVPTPRVKLTPSKDPRISAAHVSKTTQEAFAAFGRSASEIDVEIAQRFSSGSAAAPTSGQEPASKRSAAPVKDDDPIPPSPIAPKSPIVVKHTRRPGQFKPTDSLATKAATTQSAPGENSSVAEGNDTCLEGNDT